MLINSLELTNFGIFRGHTVFDFEISNNEKNVILISGKNGAGKTTMLDAMRLALYGPLAYGWKNITPNYITLINNHLNLYAVKVNEDKFAIRLTLRIFIQGRAAEFKINRAWNHPSYSFEEKLTVFKNGVQLSDLDTTDFEEWIRHQFPPMLFEFFFFDAEKMEQLVKADQLEKIIRKSALSLFNLDVFTSLGIDLTSYIAQKDVQETLTQEEKTVETLAAKRSHLLEEELDAAQQLSLLDIAIENETRNLAEAEHEFRLKGGRLAEEREKLRRQINDLEKRKTLLHEWIHEQFSNLLPFWIIARKLPQLRDQLKNENEKQMYDALMGKLNHETLQQILQDIAKNPADASTELSQSLWHRIDALIKPSISTSDFSMIHNLSPDDAGRLVALITSIEAIDPARVTRSFQEIREANSTVQALRTELQASNPQGTVAELLEQTNAITAAVEKMKHEKIELQNAQEARSLELVGINVALESAKQSLLASQHDETVYQISQRVINVVDTFVENRMKKRLLGVQQHFQTMFTHLIRKEDMVSSITIQGNFQEFEIRNRHDLIMQKQHLSKGETQVFLLSLVWALVQESGREFPMVFDSLLGRLDKTHRQNILSLYLPKSGAQSIVLATDTEIDAHYYNVLKPHIAKEYHIDYNPETQTVDIQNQFPFGLEEVSA